MKSFSGLICYGVFPLGLDLLPFLKECTPLSKKIILSGSHFCINIESSVHTTEFKENMGHWYIKLEIILTCYGYNQACLHFPKTCKKCRISLILHKYIRYFLLKSFILVWKLQSKMSRDQIDCQCIKWQYQTISYLDITCLN